MSRMFKTTAAVAALMLPAAFLIGCGSTQLTSTRPTTPITVNGDASDWVGQSLYVDKSGISFAVAHDAEYLYLLVSTTDRNTKAQVLRGGLTMWFDPDGGSDRIFGIRYPAGMPGGPPRGGAKFGPGLAPPGGSSQGEEPDTDGWKLPDESMRRTWTNEIEVLGPDGEDAMIVSLLAEQQIQAKIDDAAGSLTLEARVPLAQDEAHPFGIGVRAGMNVGVGLETSGPSFGSMGGPQGGRGGMSIEHPDGDGDPAGGMRPPGGEGRGGGRGSRGGGLPRGERGAAPTGDAVDIWTTVALTR